MDLGTISFSRPSVHQTAVLTAPDLPERPAVVLSSGSEHREIEFPESRWIAKEVEFDDLAVSDGDVSNGRRRLRTEEPTERAGRRGGVGTRAGRI
jgi:hypothetical protein